MITNNNYNNNKQEKNKNKMKVDPLDLKWQADTTYAPDKEITWTHPAETDGWMHAHNAIRGELADIKMALTKCEERGDLPEWAVVAIQQVWKNHSEHVHAHHKNEDELFVPFLDTRIKLPEKVGLRI